MGQVSRWSLKYPARKWQEFALDLWSLEMRGVVEVVTGAGKTFFALQCMLRVIEKYPTCRFLILVPSTTLLDQWRASLIAALGVSPEDIALVGGGHKLPPTPKPITIAVINSARVASPAVHLPGPWCLIVDECHRSASPANRQALEGSFVATLGLSATPERQYDPWFEDHVVPVLGPVLFKYTYAQAKADGILSDFSLWNVCVPLTDEESEEISTVNKRIGREMGRLQSLGLSESQTLTRLLMKRSRLSQLASSRLSATVHFASKWAGKRGLIFHESVDHADFLAKALNDRGQRARTYHSKLSPALRYENLRQYMQGQVDVIVSCRALDEGFDVPDTDFGIIAASTSSRRQRIQRLGRLLRPSPHQTEAIIVSLYALEHEGEILRREAENLKGIGAIRWFKAARQ